MWGPRADLYEKLQGNIRLQGEYTCGGLEGEYTCGGLEGEYTRGDPGLISVRNYRATSGWRVSAHVGPRTDLCEKLQGNIRLEGEYTCGDPGLIPVRNYWTTSGWRVSTY